MPKARTDYRQLWNEMIGRLCAEIVAIGKLGKKRTIEDCWIQGTLLQVAKAMCAAHRLHRSLQEPPVPMRTLFDDGNEAKDAR